jgi:hypothetical protein
MPLIQFFYRAYLAEFFSEPRISTGGFRKYAIKPLLICCCAPRCLQHGTG